MEEQKKKILKMLSEGKINEQQAEELLDAIGGSEKENKSVSVVTDKASFEESFQKFKEDAKKSGEGFLLVYVNSADGDNVKVKLPMRFVKIMISAAKTKENINFNGVDLDTETLKNAIENGLVGRIVEVESDTGDKVIVEII